MANSIPSQQAAPFSASQTLEQAIAHHQAGQLMEAEMLYLAILQTEPNHPEANHNMGVLAVQQKQPAAGLPYFMAALDVDPACKQYWLSYIDALFQAGFLENAREVLVLAQQQGLQGDEVDALAAQLTVVGVEYAVKESSNLAQSVGQNSKTKITRQGKSVRKSTQHQEKNPCNQEINTLVSLFKQGRYKEAATFAQTMTVRFPTYGFGWKVLGAVYQQMGLSTDALSPMQKAAALLPNDADVHSNLGAVFQDLGCMDEAEASLRRALRIDLNNVQALNNLSVTLLALSRLGEAEANIRKVLQIRPDFAEAHNNLGNILNRFGRLAEAEASYRQALLYRSDFVDAHFNLGITLQEMGRLNEAEASYRLALQNKPDYAVVHNNLGSTLKEMGRLVEAETSYRLALKINPDYADAYSNLGALQMSVGQLSEAEANYRRAIQIKPDFAMAYSNLGVALQDMGRLDEAEACFRKALEIKPDYAAPYNNLLFIHGYHASMDTREYLSLACNWEHACVGAQDRLAAFNRTFQNSSLTGRRLRVGYMSGDYRSHAVSYFIGQLFAHHDRGRIELYAYSTNTQVDAVTKHLQTLAEHWVQVAGMNDAAIRNRIESDRIDVLIDLSGHTSHNRLGVFALRAAPVQAHYLGYFASSGLTHMDYWIGDEILTPAETDSHFSEQIWRLPRVWVSYEGKADAPAPDWRPSQDATIWLGGFNSLCKLTQETLSLWARVLHVLPEARLLLKAKELSDTGNRQRLLDVMSSHGILPDRIELQDRNATPDWAAHMAYYDRLDIALDPVGGLGGGTTTCDALWMGVPVIALEGDRMASHMTASMLNAIGRLEWIACSEVEYINKVVALARDVELRKALRFSQRDQMASSALCDARGLAISLENAYYEMFEQWLGKKK